MAVVLSVWFRPLTPTAQEVKARLYQILGSLGNLEKVQRAKDIAHDGALTKVDVQTTGCQKDSATGNIRHR